MSLTPEQQAAVAEIMADAAKWQATRKIDFYTPYLKQQEFHRQGRLNRERGLIAGNRIGKSECAAAEVAMHLTGQYPSWWDGYRFNHAITAWAAGEDGELTRDISQAKLCGIPGLPEMHGTGYIPKDTFVGPPSSARGTTDLYDTIHIRHVSGGVSALTFKTYGEKRKGFQAATLDLVWLDEEPDVEIYSEARTRTATTQGLTILTCTPLKGRTTLINRIKYENAPGRAYVNMGIFDACKGHDPLRPSLGHFTREQAEAEIAAYEAYEREARAYGIESLGEGRVFLTDENELKIPAFDHLPRYFRLIWGVDFGGAGSGSHPFAAVLLAHDPDYDIIFLLRALKLQGMTMLQHIPVMREICALAPVAWPHDGNEKDRNSGIALAEQYRNPMPGMPGLLMLQEHATWPDGGFSTSAAVDELDARAKTGRFKVVETEHHFFDEYRMYHREKGLLVKINDDVLSAVFKGLMMLRAARPVGLGGDKTGAGRVRQRSGTTMDIDPFSGAPVARDRY